MVDVARLRTLTEVARHGSFTAAADALAYTQPSVSRQIATLESEVGMRLLERDVRPVRLTQAGEVLVEHAEAVLARLDAARAELEALSGLEGGRLRVSAFGSANVWLVPEAFSLFAGRYPKVELSLTRAELGDQDRVEGTVEMAPLVAALRSGDVDLALITSWDFPDPSATHDIDGVETVQLLEDELYLALPRGHRLAGRKRLAFSDLARETWIEGAHPDCLGSLAELGRLIGAEPHIGFHCDDWTGKQALVAAGVGIMLMPRRRCWGQGSSPSRSRSCASRAATRRCACTCPRWPIWRSCSPRWRPTGWRRIRAVDRRHASSSINAGLLFAGVALGVFALTFVAAIIYIG